MMPEMPANWQAWYGLDFSPLEEIMRRRPQRFSARSASAREWPALADPALLASIDLRTVTLAQVDVTVPAAAQRSGTLNGVILYFVAQLGPDTALTTHPAQALDSNSWRHMVWAFTEALSLEAGEPFVLKYRYGIPGEENEVRASRL